MLSENFVTAIRSQPRSANTAIAKDVGIYLHELQPNPVLKASYKKSSTPVNALAVSSTHIFAAQADKAVLHVYSRERGNHEATISFGDEVRSLALVGNGLLVVGTKSGKVLLWELSTGRNVPIVDAHITAVSCLAATQHHIVSGSESSDIQVWSIPQVLSFSSKERPRSICSLSNHRAAITNLVLGHGSSSTNICVSSSKDNTIIIWNYCSGDLLRTFLVPSTPLCLVLDPCDRAVFVGFDDGSVQMIEFIQPTSMVNPLYDASLQNTPVQITKSPWSAPSEIGSALCIGLSYDGTGLLSGHASGKIIQWDTGRCSYSAEIADLNAPVTNLVMLSPFLDTRMTKTATVVKPKQGNVLPSNYTLTAQLAGPMSQDAFRNAVDSPGFPTGILEDAISCFSAPVATSSSGDDKLRKENEDLWKVINEQRSLQKKTWDQYTKLKSGGA